MAQPPNELDDLDLKEYMLRVVNPRWLGTLEDRVRCALERVGFQIDRLITNEDGSMVTFWLRRGERAQFTSVEAASAALQQALTNVDCPCGEQELALAVEGDRWNGAYVPVPPEIDPMRYVNALPAYA